MPCVWLNNLLKSDKSIDMIFSLAIKEKKAHYFLKLQVENVHFLPNITVTGKGSK